MGLKDKLAIYRDHKSGIKHCTFDPLGPGVVRIHLIPPRFNLFKTSNYIVILNGYYLLPLGYSWAIMLSIFIEETNKFDGIALPTDAQQQIFANTLQKMHKVYPSIDMALLADDLQEMLTIMFDVARGNTPNANIEKLSIRKYAPKMEAPHRMDLMISSMADDNGNWKCNQKCAFCYAAGQTYSAVKELSTDEWKKAIDNLKKANVPMLTFTGGEPTLRSDLPELISHSKWFITRLNTNGVLLTPQLVQQLKEAQLDSVQITLYSAQEQIHNKLVGSNHFADTLQGIKNAIEAGLDVSVNTPLCRDNANYIATLQLLNNLGVKYVTVSGLICTGTAKDTHQQQDLTADELANILAQAKEFCDNNNMEINFTSPGLVAKEVMENLGLQVPSCGAALSNMAVAPDGTVLPCQSWLASDASLGNILTDNFKTIWKHKKAVALRKMSDSQALNCPFRTNASKEANHDN